MTTRENVMLGRMFGGDPVDPSIAGREADALLERVGLAGRAHRSIITKDRSVVPVEQNVHQSARLADRVYVLENGSSGPDPRRRSARTRSFSRPRCVFW